MDTERWQQVRALAEEAWALATADERAAFLNRECDDPDLRREVEALVAADDDSEDFFGALAARSGLSHDDEAPDLSGRTVGAYRLIEPLGRGGMGVVYLAERADGEFEHQVAVKLLPMGMTTPDASARFLAERQILAGLEHPSIARLLDGGVTEDGTPYFVMERVYGERIDRWCDQRRLAVDDRLRLMIRVCEAVEAAHRQLIVHRDLKPANVLVTDDGQSKDGQPKLLDFGVAKVLSETGPGVTQSRGAPLTPAWAAPEQISGEPITTATDTHALGALAYLLLTGVPPYDLGDTSPTALTARLSTDAPAPSRRFATLDAAEQDEVAAARGTTPGALTRALQGDLDAVLSRALAPESERRYGRAGELAADLGNHLKGLPVAARAPSAGYRLRKFVRRNRAAVAAAIGFVVLLSGALVVVTLEQRETARQRDRARRVTDFTLGLFEAGNPESGEDVSARQLLDEGLARLDELNDDPIAQAEMLSVIGAAFLRLTEYDKAEDAYRRELALRLEHQHPAAPEVATAFSAVGTSLSIQGEIEEGGELLRKAVELDQTYFRGVDREESIWHLRELSRHYRRNGHLDRAKESAERGLAMARRLWGPEHKQVGSFLNTLAFIAVEVGDYARAQELHEQSLAVTIGSVGEDHPDTATGLHNLGFMALQAGSLEESEDYYRQALDLKRRLFDPTHPSIGSSLVGLGNVMLEAGRLDEAERLLLESIEVKEATQGRVNASLLAPLLYLAELERKRGDLTAAEIHLDEALEIARATVGEHGSRQARIWRGFAELREEQGREEEAITAYRNELTSLETLGEPNRRWIDPLHALARLLAESDPAEALPLLEQADSLAREHLPADDPVRQQIAAELSALRKVEA